MSIERGMYRNRRWLDLAHECDVCMNCARRTPQGCEPAHSSESEHGKGVGQKSHDCFAAFLCYLCHRWYDNQLGYGRDPSGVFEHTNEGKAEMFRRALDRTWLHLVRLKKLVLA